MRRRPTPPVTRFRAFLKGAEVRLIAMPPDEADPASDYLWRVAVEGRAELPAGTGFTSHQAVHSLIEALELAGHTLTGVIQLHEPA